MTSRKTLSAENLKALGVEHLAGLLLEIAAGHAVVKRRLRLELAGAGSPRELAHEVRKRLAAIARSRSFIDWQGHKALVQDLETQRRAIAERVAKADAGEALELMWRFLDLAGPIHDRSDDSNGDIGDVFRTACRDLGALAQAARPEARALADRVFAALNANGYGQYDGLIETLVPVLGVGGLDRLKARFVALSKTPVETPRTAERRVVGWGSGGPLYADEIEARGRASTIRLALMNIADAQGDVDGFIAQYRAPARKAPRIAAEIARRLLAGGRAGEAWQFLEAVEHRRGVEPDFEWEDGRIDTLEALGRGPEAQAARWSCFERALSVPHLRAYLKRLADFDDVEAEDQALGHAESHRDLLLALAFLVSWPALERAAGLVVRRAKELDGNRYEFLAPAAEALAGRHPLAAMLLLRAMIDFTLTTGRSSRYRHAARHLTECAGLAGVVVEFGRFETHDIYEARLRREHARKTGFWSLVS